MEEDDTSALIAAGFLSLYGISAARAACDAEAVKTILSPRGAIHLILLTVAYADPERASRSVYRIRAAQDLVSLARCPIVALSTLSVEELFDACPQANFDAHVRIPFTGDQLFDAIDPYVDPSGELRRARILTEFADAIEESEDSEETR